MIRLSKSPLVFGKPKPIYFTPEQIIAVDSCGDGSNIYTAESTTSFWTVAENPLDVARLRAAWEQRFNASELHGNLPLAVYMDGEGDSRSIQFMCCAITERLRQEKLAAEREAENAKP